MRTHLHGLDILGQETNRAILIKVHNAGDLARRQGGIAAFAQALAPATIENEVYKAMRDKLAKSLAAENIKADVTVVSEDGFKTVDGSHIGRDLGLAVAGVGGIALLWHLFKGKKRR